MIIDLFKRFMQQLYVCFLGVKQDHNTKLYGYKESLNRLPKVNRNTLKVVIGHLKRSVLNSENGFF